MNVHVVYCVKLHLKIKQIQNRFDAAESQRLTLEARLAKQPPWLLCETSEVELPMEMASILPEVSTNCTYYYRL